MTSDTSVAALFGSLDALHGLVNCAGILRRGEEYDLTVFARVIEVNLIGTMRCCVAARPLLERSGGAIVNLASCLSVMAIADRFAYGTSKGAVLSMTTVLEREVVFPARSVAVKVRL